MSMLAQVSMVVTAYVAMGRTGAIAACIWLEGGLVMTVVMSLILDFVQIPVYGVMLEASTSPKLSGKRIAGWIERRREILREKEQHSRFWGPVMRFKPLAIMLVAIIPVRGCGIISACVLSFMLGLGRLKATALIMGGSLIGAVVTLLVLLKPVRLLHGL